MDHRPADSDRLDIRASLEGEEDAYARLVRRYQPLVSAQMWRFTRDRDILAELAQDVFVEVYLSLGSYRGRAPFLHWVRRIATRVGYRYWKRQARERRRRVAFAEWKRSPPSLGMDPSPSEAAVYLQALLEQLDPPDRLVLTLQCFEGCNTREIADRTGWSRALVKVRAHRARCKLRAKLTRMGWRRGEDA